MPSEPHEPPEHAAGRRPLLDGLVAWASRAHDRAYLGLGVQKPTPAWGLLLQGAAEEYPENAPWIPFFPGVAITMAVFAFNLFGDSLRDVLDPKLRAR